MDLLINNYPENVNTILNDVLYLLNYIHTFYKKLSDGKFIKKKNIS